MTGNAPIVHVTGAASIAAVVEQAGPVDVSVNNAGIGVIGALEATPMSKSREVFETNTLGVIAMPLRFAVDSVEDLDPHGDIADALTTFAA